jgi:hypothetical protein
MCPSRDASLCGTLKYADKKSNKNEKSTCNAGNTMGGYGRYNELVLLLKRRFRNK